MRRFLGWGMLVLGSLLALTPASGFAPQQDQAAELRTKFEREANPVRKAKQLPKLGEAELREIRDQLGVRDYGGALKTLQAYRDQVQTALKGLDEAVPDPAGHSAGYRQMEISVREALRRLNDMTFPIPPDEKAPFMNIVKELDDVDRRLLKILFPRDAPPDSAPSPRP